MRKYIFILLLLNQYYGYSQTKISIKDSTVIYTFFDAYNNNDYKLIRKNIFFMGRVILNESKLSSALTELRNAYGKFKILNIEEQAPKNYIINVSSERDSTEYEKFAFQLNRFHKIQSFRVAPKQYRYKKNLFLDKREQQKYKQIDSLINYKYKYGGFNGSIAILHNNELYYKKTVGYRNYTDKSLLNDSSIYYLASCSKQFTAMSILMLSEQGKLKLDDTLQKYFLNFPYKNITIENLLTHTSGLPDYMSLMKAKNNAQTFTNKDVLDFFTDNKPKSYFKPSSQFEYSNTGYVLLALIIEKCSGLSYPDFIKQHIFQPLNMQNATVNGASFETGSKIANWVFGHIFSDSLGRYIPYDSLDNHQYVKTLDLIYGDGNVNCSIDDFIKWELALRNNILIKKENTEKMFSTVTINESKKINYGYGQCVIDNESYQKQVFHGGYWAGFNTMVFRLIDSEITIIILTNNEYPSINQLNNNISEILLGM